MENRNERHEDPVLQPGGPAACGVAHPGTTFDRWQVLLAVADDYTVEFALNTFF